MEQSEQIDQLTAALAKAAGKFKPLVPDQTNPHFKSRFASLQKCIEVTRPALLAEGIVVTQWPEPSPDGTIGLTTKLSCGDQSMQSTWFLPVPQITPQGFGSAFTYARRYAYCAALGLAPDEDDDGNGTQGAPEAPRSLPAQGYKRGDDYVISPQNKHEEYRGKTFEQVWQMGDEGQKYVRACAHFEGGNPKMMDAAKAVLEAHAPDDSIPF
jgi:hypothetical protein